MTNANDRNDHSFKIVRGLARVAGCERDWRYSSNIAVAQCTYTMSSSSNSIKPEDCVKVESSQSIDAITFEVGLPGDAYYSVSKSGNAFTYTASVLVPHDDSDSPSKRSREYFVIENAFIANRDMAGFNASPRSFDKEFHAIGIRDDIIDALKTSIIEEDSGTVQCNITGINVFGTEGSLDNGNITWFKSKEIGDVKNRFTATVSAGVQTPIDYGTRLGAKGNPAYVIKAGVTFKLSLRVEYDDAVAAYKALHPSVAPGEITPEVLKKEPPPASMSGDWKLKAGIHSATIKRIAGDVKVSKFPRESFNTAPVMIIGMETEIVDLSDL